MQQRFWWWTQGNLVMMAQDFGFINADWGLGCGGVKVRVRYALPFRGAKGLTPFITVKSGRASTFASTVWNQSSNMT